MMKAEEKDYTAIVEKVVEKGKHGPYVVTRCDEIGTVTFSLSSDVWQEDKNPTPGTYVVLSNVLKKRSGWRAEHARLFKPSDEGKH